MKKQTLTPSKVFKSCHSWQPDQLMIMLNNSPNIVGSWGTHNITFFEDYQFLRFSVDARRFKGQINIFLHANDTFLIFGTESNYISFELNEVYIDEIVNVIDEKIERIDTYNPEIK